MKISKLFPHDGLIGEEIHLNSEAAFMFKFRDMHNPLLDPQFCYAWIKHLHKTKKINFSYGGYLENRNFLWRDSYLEPTKFIHLGVDVNYGQNCSVLCPVPFKVLEKFQDTDQNGGWGLRVLVETDRGFVIFAHLMNVTEKDDDITEIEVGKSYEEGTCVGAIGMPHCNGGWFPHLHLQGIRDISLLKDLDGYAKIGEENLHVDYPNPLDILGLK